MAVGTGEGSGIGRAWAIRWAGDGALVTIDDINMEGGAQVVAEIANAGGKADTVHCDITTEESIKAAIEGVVAKHGRLDILHNNAAYVPVEVLERSEEHTSELQSLMRISYAVFCLKKKKNNTRDQEQQT